MFPHNNIPAYRLYSFGKCSKFIRRTTGDAKIDTRIAPAMQIEFAEKIT